MTSRPPALLDPLRVRIRRLQLIVGIGFLSLVVGSITTAALSAKIAPRIEGLESGWMRFALSMLVAGVWAYAVLPLFCYGAARVVELKPWPTAIGAAITGELFTLAIFFVTGALSTAESSLRVLLPRLFLLAAGITLSAFAVRRARADSAGQEEKAKAAAVAKKDEYAEFTREAERIAAKHDLPRDEPSAVAATAPTSGDNGDRPAPLPTAAAGLPAPEPAQTASGAPSAALDPATHSEPPQVSEGDAPNQASVDAKKNES